MFRLFATAASVQVKPRWVSAVLVVSLASAQLVQTIAPKSFPEETVTP